MADIKVRCKNFTGSYSGINGIVKRSITRLDVIRAIITIGAEKSSDILYLGLGALLHRFGIGLSAISFLELSGSNLNLSPDFISLDMTEKGSISYWYGMAFTKLVGEIELGIPWLAHVDRLRASGALRTVAGISIRGDLVGRGSSGDWHAIEAKGRSNGVSKELVNYAKTQASYILSINGRPPATTIASIVYLNTSPISVLFDDPEVKNERGEVWDIDDDGFFDEYYKVIVEYLRLVSYEELTVGNAEFIVTSSVPPVLQGFGLSNSRIGILKEIFEKPRLAPRAVKQLGFIDMKDKQISIGLDGIIVSGPDMDWERNA